MRGERLAYGKVKGIVKRMFQSVQDKLVRKA